MLAWIIETQAGYSDCVTFAELIEIVGSSSINIDAYTQSAYLLCTFRALVPIFSMRE
jgi:hypothetical protein